MEATASRRRRAVGVVLGLVAATAVAVAGPAGQVGATPLAGTIRTVAGGPGGGTAREIAVEPMSVAFGDGKLYVSDEWRTVVRRVDVASGQQQVVAGNGSQGIEAGDGMLATDVNLFGVTDIAVTPSGAIVLAQDIFHRLAQVRTDGRFETIVNAHEMKTVAVDGLGNIYAGDGNNGRVVKRNPTTGQLVDLVPVGSVRPADLAADGAGNVYAATGSDIKKITPSGTVTTILTYLDVGGLGIRSVAVTPGGALSFVAEAQGQTSRVVGRVTAGGPALVPLPPYPCVAQGLLPSYETDIAVDGEGNAYIGDGTCAAVWKLDAAGNLTEAVGNRQRGFSGDVGAATAAQLHGPTDVVRDAAGNLFVADTENNRVRRVDPAGRITTVAGTGAFGQTGDGGPATAAALTRPTGLAFDGNGTLYIAADTIVRKVDASGTISTVQGNYGDVKYAATFRSVGDVLVDGAGNVIVTDWYAFKVHRIAPDGSMTVIAGDGTNGTGGDGGLATSAQFSQLSQIAFGPDGGLYLADYARVRRIDPAGFISTIAGTGVWGEAGDGGPATAALLGYVRGLAFDGDGNLFVSSSGNVRRIDGSGVIERFAGRNMCGYQGDGGSSLDARLCNPAGMTVSAGTLYVADPGTDRVRTVSQWGAPTTTTTTTTTPPTTPSTTTTTVPANGVVQNTYAIGTQAAQTPLNGTGIWMVVASDPSAAGAGKLAPTYVFGQVFTFTGSGAVGTLGFLTAPTAKIAVASVTAPDGTPHTVAVPFDWKPGRFYFFLFHQQAPGVWVALVLDQTANQWTLIGQLTLPTEWGKLVSGSLTTVSWYGGAAPCAKVPGADVFTSAPVGFVNGTATSATYSSQGTLPGTCPSTVTTDVPGWARHHVGS